MDPNQKSSLVHSIFSSVASQYDVMNDVMSAGIHRLWKNHFVKQLPLSNNCIMLDVAGGTGDIAFRAQQLALKKGLAIDVTLCDINNAMLVEGKKKALNTNQFQHLHWVTGNAESLPVEDCSIDIYTIVFGIRNVSHIDLALEEAYRVLKPSGVFMCMEFSHVNQPFLAKCYDLYSQHCIPSMGNMITGNREAYEYLVNSIRLFPKKEAFASMIKTTGFSQVSVETLSAGIVAIHKGWRV